MINRSIAGLVAAAALTVMTTIAPAGAQQPKKGGTLTMIMFTDPTALVTIATTALPTGVTHPKILESLLEYSGPEMTPKPGLAESWTVSDDQKTYTFKLRQGVKFHDGAPMTSADVAFSIDKVVRPYHSRGKVNFEQVTAIETPDAHTVVFKLKQPQPYFIKVFQPTETPIMPKHVIDVPGADLTKIRTSPFMQNPIGTGPFKLAEFRKGSHIILDRNPDYYRPGLPYLDRIVIRILPDDSARVIAMEKGEADVAVYGSLPEAEIGRLAGLPHIKSSADGMEAIGPVANFTLNLRDEHLKDQRVRQAISLSLDRRAIANVVFYGLARPAASPIFPGNPLLNTNLPPFEYNLARANALLDEAGYKPGAGGMRFKLNLDYIPYGATWARLADYTKSQLRRIGIDATIRTMDFGAYMKQTYTEWDFQMTATFGNTYADPAIGTARYYVSSSIVKGGAFNNVGGYSNPRVDTLFAQGALEPDAQKRKAMYDEAQEIMHRELPVLWLVAMPTTTLWNKRVQNLIANGISPYTNYAEVWVE